MINAYQWVKGVEKYMRYGYARVSSNGQNLARQIQILEEHNVTTIFQEHASGADNERPVLHQLLTQLRPGDELVVVSLERLGRDAEYLTQLMVILETRKIHLLSLDIPDFAEVDNRNIQRLLHNLVVELKKFIAADELERIGERQRQGIALAKRRGVYKGRPARYTADATVPADRLAYQRIVALLKIGTPIAAIMREVGVSNTVVYRIKKGLDH
jgi:DNA invertase Pin-like site-specific DNA recombinase